MNTNNDQPDIVERARAQVSTIKTDWQWVEYDNAEVEVVRDLLQELADTIERLRSERTEALRAATVRGQKMLEAEALRDKYCCDAAQAEAEVARLRDEASSHARLMYERAQQIVTLEAEVERLSEHIRLERKYQELAYLAERRLEHVLMNCTITCNHEYDADGREAATRIRTTDDIDNRMGEQ